MAKKIQIITLLSTLAALGTVVWYGFTAAPLALTMAITFCTIAYHFIMRLAVGWVIDRMLRNRIDYRAKWFAVSQTELKFYQKIRIKKWKNQMPTYDPSTFDKKLHS